MISRISSNSGCSGRNISSNASNTPLSELTARFESRGGLFLKKPDALAARLAGVRALVFDWDGVFNAGEKALGTTSGFAEADSMGVNMLRYGLWRRDGCLPRVAIITGEPNASAQFFAEREHFDALYQRVKDKRVALSDFCDRCDLAPKQVACLFDDINDIGMASQCGVRILIRRDASDLMREYLCRSAICDYVTASESGNFAVREASELMLALSCLFDEIIESRVAFDEQYQAYLAARQAVELDVVSAAEPH